MQKTRRALGTGLLMICMLSPPALAVRMVIPVRYADRCAHDGKGRGGLRHDGGAERGGSGVSG